MYAMISNRSDREPPSVEYDKEKGLVRFHWSSAGLYVSSTIAEAEDLQAQLDAALAAARAHLEPVG